MSIDIGQLQQWIAMLIWPLARVSGLALVAPVFGATMIPARVRMGLVVVLSLTLMPLVHVPHDIDPLSLKSLLVVIEQLLTGAAIGLVLRMAFEAVAVAGQVISSTMGLGFAEVVSPQDGAQTQVLSQFYTVLVTLLFLAMDGHLELLRLLAEGMRGSSLAHAHVGDRGMWQMLVWAGHLFSGAVRVALPALMALLIVNAGFAAISRAAPSMNLFAVGFPITLSLGFIVVWLSLPLLPGAFRALLNAAAPMLHALAGS